MPLKIEALEIGGGDKPEYHPNMDVRTLPTVDVVGAWEDGIPFPDNSFDLVYSSHTLEHIPIQKVEFALLEAYRVLKPGGKLVLELPDLEAIIFDTHGEDLSEFEIRRIYGDQDYPGNFHKGGLSPAYLEKLLHQAGFGKTIENRQGLCFRMIAYKGDIKWLVTDDISYGELVDRHVVLTRDTDRNWNGILNRLEAEPESREAAGLMSTLSPAPRLTKFVLENFLEESWDEVYLTHDVIDEEFFNYLRGLFQSDNRITIIFNPDLMGVVNAWNQLFVSARSKFLFVDSCDFYIHRPIKEPVLNHFNNHEDWAWIVFPREQVKASSYASALRASTLKQVGYLSEYLNPCVFDDNDLAMKLASIGKKVLSCAHIEVAHLGRRFQGTCDIMHTMGPALFFRQQRRYVQRWGSQNFFDFSLVPSCTDLDPTPTGPAPQFDRFSWTRDRINELIRGKQDAKIVDIGCGTCPLTSEMANCTFVDSDSYEKIVTEMKTYGRTIPRDKFVQASADDLPFENKYFEVAIAGELLEHMADPIKTLEEIKRVAKHVILTVPDEYSWDLKYKPFQNPAHIRLYTEEMLKEHLKKAKINHYTFDHLVYEGWAFLTAVADLGEVSTAKKKPAKQTRAPLSIPGNDKLKIALLSTPFIKVPPDRYGGLERVVADLAYGLAQAGHQITVFAPDGSSVEGCEMACFGPPIDTVHVNWLEAEQKAVNVVASRIMNDGYSIIHGHNWFGFEYALKAMKPELKVCHTHHGGLNMDWWGRSKPPWPLNLIALSNWMQKYYAGLGFNSKVVYNGIPIEDYGFKAEKGDRLLFVGRLDSFKQPHIAIEVAKKAGLGLDITGGSFVYDTAYLEAIKQACDGEQIKLHLDASHEKKIKLYQNAKAVIFPPKMGEPFGLIVPEANACGTLVIAARDGAIPETIEEGVTGFVCDNVNQMVEAVSKVGQIKPEACRERVERLFSRQVMAKNYIEAFQSILGGNEW